MKDFLGQELNTGDEVAFMAIGYRHLVKGTIISIGKVKATIEFKGKYGGDRTFQEQNQIIKI